MSTFPEQPMPPTLKGMTPPENEVWLNAHNWAYKSIVAALKRVQNSPNPTPSNDYARWFETESIFTPHANWIERRNVVIDSLTKMATRMSTVSVVYKKSNDSEKCRLPWDQMEREAFTEIGGQADRDIGLCRHAFNDDQLRFRYWDAPDWARAFILAHETYHAAVDTRQSVETSDSYYNWTICQKLAFFNPGLAVKNAQNYALFIMGAGWVRIESPPGWLPDHGIWYEPTAGAGWGSAADSPAAAATTHTQNLVMVGYREPEAHGGRLRYRILQLKDGRENWFDPMLLKISGEDGAARDCKSLTPPALAAHGQEFYCAYIDHETKYLLFARADTAGAMNTGNWSDLRWGGSLVVPEEIDRYPMSNPGPVNGPSPALAAYRPDLGVNVLNQSAGLYCVYVSGTNDLKCAARLDGGRGRWIQVPFDRRRTTAVTPALVMFNRQLRCAYVDGATGQLVMLTYRPVTSHPSMRDAKAGTWHEESHSIMPLETEAIALGQWNTPRGEMLVAVGNKAQEKDGSLRFSLFSESAGWAKEKRLATLTSPNCFALAGCGGSLYLFYRSVDGAIQSRVAREKV